MINVAFFGFVNVHQCSLVVATVLKQALRAACRSLFWHLRESSIGMHKIRTTSDLHFKTRSVKAVANSGSCIRSLVRFSLESFHSTAGRSTSTVAFLGRSESADSSPASVPANMVSSIFCVCSANAYVARSTPDSTMYSPSEASPCLHKTWPGPSVSRSRYDLSG